MVFDPLPQYFEINSNHPDNLINKEKFGFLPNILKESKLFSIEKNIVEAIKNTKIDKSAKLPFLDIIIIPENFYIKNKKLNAISVISLENKPWFDFSYKGCVYSQQKDRNGRNIKPRKLLILSVDTGNGFTFTQPLFDFTNQFKKIDNFVLELSNDMSPPKIFNGKSWEDLIDPTNKNVLTNKECYLCEKLLLGFLNFINNPEVKIIEQKTDEDRNQKRIRSGKIFIPTRVNIRITGKLKVYLENFRQQTQRYGHTHRFWVRGHFMHWRSDRYTNMKGKKTWVVPYIKGEGILINKTYSVVKPNA